MADTPGIIRRIRALMEKTVARGCTEAEAMAAAEAVGRMMDEHDLSLTDLQISSSTTRRASVNTGAKSDKQPQIHCCSAIAFFTDTKVWLSYTPTRNRTVEWIGLDADVVMAEYLYAIIDRALTNEYIIWSAKNVGSRFHFWDGMTGRINVRLREMKKARDKHNESTGRDLVVVKSALVKAAFAELGFTLGPVKKTRSVNPRTAADLNALMAGREAGDRLSLASGLSGEAGNKLR